MNNPGIDTVIWERLRKRWADLEAAGAQLKVDFRLIVDPKDDNHVWAMDVHQNINDEMITETVQQKPGEAYAALGIAGLSMELIVQACKEKMQDLHRQAKLSNDTDLVVIMSPSSPTSGEVRGYEGKPDSQTSVPVNYRHYYLLNALREKIMGITGDGWSTVKAVYRSDTLEFYFEY